jgi:hypothetical protein
LIILVSLNFLIQRFAPRFALKHGEFMTVYVMLSVSSALAGHDMIQTVMPTISDGFWFATPENEWKQLFWRHLPSWMVVDNFSTLEGFYEGESTFYTPHHFRHWIWPTVWWTAFLTGLTWVMICLSVLLKKQWIEHERLSYPIIQLPLEMTRPDGRLFKSKMMSSFPFSRKSPCVKRRLGTTLPKSHGMQWVGRRFTSSRLPLGSDF